MPRDYKHTSEKKPGDTSLWTNRHAVFFGGVACGVFVAFLAFLYYQNYYAQGAAPAKSQTQETKSGAEATRPKPRFDFYKILPDREVNISEWVAKEQDKDLPQVNDRNVYVLQVGSFTKHQAADQTRGQLALLGIASEIQRVVINGQDVRYRVRIGPYEDPVQLKEARQRLLENELDFMILKLKLSEDAASG